MKTMRLSPGITSSEATKTNNEKEDRLMSLKLGSKSPQVKILQESLVKLGFLSSMADGIFGPKTEQAVEKMQSSCKILLDGIVGPGTVHEIDLLLKAINEPPSGITLYIAASNLKNPKRKIRWIKCKADVFPGRGGYGSLTLRSDTAAAYRNLYDDVHALGGVITTAGGKRPLSGKSSPSRSKKSMHYVGLAFDLALPTGMQDAEKDPYVIVDMGDRLWEVWCRTDDESVPVVSLKSCTASSSSGKTKLIKKTVTGRFFSFTELAKHHGFKPIRGRSSFFRGGSYTGAEWWHFQWESTLQKGASKFGEELLLLYPIEKCQKFAYWDQVKHCVYGIDWF